MRKLWIAIMVLALISPIGILLPYLLGAGSAWGEWSSEEVGKMVGFAPEGMEKIEALWRAPVPDYSIPFLGESLGGLSVGYIISAFVGVISVVALMYGMGKYMTKGRNDAS